MAVTPSVGLCSLSPLAPGVVTRQLDMSLHLCLHWVVSALSVGLVSVAGDWPGLGLLNTSSAGAIC